MPCLDINTMQTITFVLCDNGDQMTAEFNRKSCTCTLVERMDVIIFKFYVLDFKIFKTKNETSVIQSPRISPKTAV